MVFGTHGVLWCSLLISHFLVLGSLNYECRKVVALDRKQGYGEGRRDLWMKRIGFFFVLLTIPGGMKIWKRILKDQSNITSQSIWEDKHNLPQKKDHDGEAWRWIYGKLFPLCSYHCWCPIQLLVSRAEGLENELDTEQRRTRTSQPPPGTSASVHHCTQPLGNPLRVMVNTLFLQPKTCTNSYFDQH